MAITLLEALAIKEKLVSILMANKPFGVHAIGIGTLGNEDDYSIEIYVEDISKLGSEARLLALIPLQFHTKPLVFIEAPRFHASGITALSIDPTTYFDPLIPGISVGNSYFSEEFGTIAYFCKSLEINSSAASKVFMLSNAHVLADLSLPDPYTKTGVSQPGMGHIGHRDVATLEIFTPINFSGLPSNPNYVDAAIAFLAYENTRLLPIPKLGIVTSSIHHQNIKRNWNCSKFGAATKLTRGQIRTTHATVIIRYDVNNKDAWFEDQLIASGIKGATFSDKGDSGSLVVKGHPKATVTTAEAIGLLFANTPSYKIKKTKPLPTFKIFKLVKVSNFSAINPISAVTSALNIKLEV